MALSSLHQVIDLEWLKEAYRLTRKDGAPGIDGVMANEYAANLEANLLDPWIASVGSLQSAAGPQDIYSKNGRLA